jgi:hypothetical protein
MFMTLYIFRMYGRIWGEQGESTLTENGKKLNVFEKNSKTMMKNTKPQNEICRILVGKFSAFTEV